MDKLGKVLLISLGFIIGLSILLNVGLNLDKANWSDLFVTVGISSLILSGIEFLVGFILLFTKDKNYGVAMLTTGAILLVIGFSSCFGAFNF